MSKQELRMTTFYENGKPKNIEVADLATHDKTKAR